MITGLLLDGWYHQEGDAKDKERSVDRRKQEHGLVIFLDTDFPFVPRDLLSHSHKGLYKVMWMAWTNLLALPSWLRNTISEVEG